MTAFQLAVKYDLTLPKVIMQWIAGGFEKFTEKNQNLDQAFGVIRSQNRAKDSNRIKDGKFLQLLEWIRQDAEGFNDAYTPICSYAKAYKYIAYSETLAKDGVNVLSPPEPVKNLIQQFKKEFPNLTMPDSIQKYHSRLNEKPPPTDAELRLSKW